MAYTDIDKPSDYFNTVLYTGTGSELSISSLDFSPDWVWVKQRGADASHFLYDSVRGATKSIRSNSTNAEATVSESLKSFDSNGFTLGTSAEPNTSSGTYVGWSWKGSDSSAVSNTDGSITSTVSANTTAGFSIVSYTGDGSATATVGHGLGVEPDMIIAKQRSTGTHNWVVQHKSLSTNNVILLDTTGAAYSPSTATWDSANNSSTVFGIATNDNINASSETYIAYCFAEKKGYSKFGSYTGNGNADGTFVYTGFKPAWVMVKRTDTTNAWLMHDIKRSTLNPMDNQLFANTSGAEDTTSSNDNFDFLSQGFKCRNTGAAYNASGGTYIYMAFAENPFVTSTGIPTTAR